MKRLPAFLCLCLVACLASLCAPPLRAQTTGPQQLALAGLRSAAQQGEFKAVAADSSGDLYLLLDQGDGIRLLKTDTTAKTVLAQQHLGSAGDHPVAMTLAPGGSLYIAGTSSSGSLAGTPGARFTGPVDSSTNSFIGSFDENLSLRFLTFAGASRTSVSAIAATGDAVFLTGLIYGNGLPVTPSGIIQTPASGSFQNGFVESFSADGSTLRYATYLSAFNGNTTPAAIAADATGNAYIGGSTTSTGYPTVAALVPRSTAATTGFLTKLTLAGDGIVFSTFIPGSGISAIALDAATSTLLLTGNLDLGAFPVTSVPMPLVDTPYQSLLRMPLDGSAVASSTVVAPGMQSALAAAADGAVWVDGVLVVGSAGTAVPLLPLHTLSETGNSYLLRVVPSGSGTTVDQVARFGGLPATNPAYASLPVALESVAVDAAGSAIVAGEAQPTASSSLLATQTFDLPLTSAPTDALPSTVRDAVPPPASCTDSSLCQGAAAYLARITPGSGVSLALSTDDAPHIVLRNLGSAEATGLHITATGFSTGTTCGDTVAAGGTCEILLSGIGPGTLTVQADGAAAQTTSLPAPAVAASPLAVSARELDFGIQTSADAHAERTLTVTNLGATDQSFSSLSSENAASAGATVQELSSDCPIDGLISQKLLAAGASCHITLGLTASSDSTQDGPVQQSWMIGSRAVRLTGYSQAAALHLSASTIDFGTQFYGGLHSERYLYLSNNSSAAIGHETVAAPAGSPFTITDRCPSSLPPRSVCQIEIGYLSPLTTSTDSIALTLEQGLEAQVQGQTIPQPATTGSSANPSLSVTPATVSFDTPVVVTGVSGAAQTVTLHNTGAAPFALSLALTGDFTDATDCAATLAGGASCDVVLSFAPSQPGARTGLLTITAGSGTTPVYVALSGTGTAILPANNGTLDFGSVPVGQPSVQWYKVSQPFTTLTAAAFNSSYGVLLVEDIGYGHGQPPTSSFVPTTTGSCLNCWLGVQFTPTAMGAANTTLTLASAPGGSSYTLNLTGSGEALSGLVLTPVSQDFGTVAVHSTGAPVLFTLTNLTSGSITVSPASLTGDFSPSTAPTGGAICNGPLAQYASCFLNMQFAPTATGQREGTLSLSTSAGVATAALSGFGAADPGVSFSPSALVFQNVPGSTATVQTITVTNTGSSALQIAAPTTQNPAFAAASTCGALAVGASCAVTVSYTPGTATVTDTLTLPITATVGGGPVLTAYSLPLSATYTAESAGLQILPGDVDFGPSATNALGSTRQFTVNNLTDKPLAVSLALPQQFALSGAPCTALAPHGSCIFSASILPQTNGSITGTFSVQGTPDDGSATMTGLGFARGYGLGAGSLTITGNLAPGRLLDFGEVPSGQSRSQMLTLTNTGSASVSIRRIVSPWPFLATTTCGAALAPGGSCTATVTYSPLNQVAPDATSPLATTDTGVLTVESDAATAPDTILLTGSAGPAVVSSPSNTAPVVNLTVPQGSLAFETTPIGSTSVTQSVTLTNTGTTVLHILSTAASKDFTVSTPANCATLVPGGGCQLAITFAPQVATAETRIGAVEITSDAGTPLEYVTLIGAATPSGLSLSPTALDFGQQLVGSTRTLPLTITNLGAAVTTFSSIAATGDYAVTGGCPAAGGTLAAHASCSLTVSFTPTASGARPGTLTVASSASQSPLAVALTGTGVQAHLQIQPSALSFGDTTEGSSSRLSLTLSNTGAAAITDIRLAVTGEFTITSPCSLASLAPGTSCSVTIAFTPTAAGARTGALTVTSSDPSSPDTVSLGGTGVAPNTGSGDNNNVSFTLTVNAASQTLPPSQSASYTVTVTPVNGFTGTVALSCSAITASSHVACSLSSASVTLDGASQSIIVTLAPAASARLWPVSTTALCILFPAMLFLWGRRRKLPALFVALVCSTMVLLSAGCASGVTIKTSQTTSPLSGSYQYLVTGTSASPAMTQTVTLKLTIP